MYRRGGDHVAVTLNPGGRIQDIRSRRCCKSRSNRCCRNWTNWKNLRSRPNPISGLYSHCRKPGALFYLCTRDISPISCRLSWTPGFRTSSCISRSNNRNTPFSHHSRFRRPATPDISRSLISIQNRPERFASRHFFACNIICPGRPVSTPVPRGGGGVRGPGFCRAAKKRRISGIMKTAIHRNEKSQENAPGM